ncbi:MAG: type I restriction enzyme HsdR N-terminal domain-containing protein [Proteobacteria bacterium]|nr:type I restriction enzyme HsdR N-terminal domain-containing protein [Pseudomonadota bacterium]
MHDIHDHTRKRMTAALQHLQPVVTSARKRGINETDTVTIVKDMFGEIWGYDRYNEVTSEYKIRGSSCDIAIIMKERIKFLVEVKGVGIQLKEHQIKQAVNYGVHEGVEMVVLTNGWCWQLYSIVFKKPISYNMILSFDITALELNKDETYQKLYLLTKEKILNDDAIKEWQMVTNPYTISAVLLSIPILYLMRLETSQIFKLLTLSDQEMVLSEKQLFTIIKDHILKDSIVNSEEFKEAQKLILRLRKKMLEQRELDTTPPPPVPNTTNPKAAAKHNTAQPSTSENTDKLAS